MGSGHFLTRATGYLTEQVMHEVREVETEMGVAFDEQHIRREIAKECIYGVDLNGMAVELAKLSMWLDTLAADRPLAFLDHHLKAGNSLVGSDVTQVLSNGSPAGNDDGQITLTQAWARVRQDTLEHVMERMQELLEIDNETLEDVKSMEEIYDNIREDPSTSDYSNSPTYIPPNNSDWTFPKTPTNKWPPPLKTKTSGLKSRKKTGSAPLKTTAMMNPSSTGNLSTQRSSLTKMAKSKIAQDSMP